mmetsp:Transcript_16355/g.30978  ORF Transcript_16355/g.30978 Transcript_16355/m.30978 type:complete len:703 (-) Transcript_16355:3832-5940(-)
MSLRSIFLVLLQFFFSHASNHNLQQHTVTFKTKKYAASTRPTPLNLRSNNNLTLTSQFFKILLRGGGDQDHTTTENQTLRVGNTGTSDNPTASQNDNYHYTKIAILNLSQHAACLTPPRREYKIQPIQNGESPLVSFVMEKWIKPQLKFLTDRNRGNRVHGGGGGEEYRQQGKILAIPSSRVTSAEDHPVEFLEGSFVVPSLQVENEQDHNDNDEDEDKGLGDVTETIGCLVDCIVLFYDTSFSARQKCIVRLIKGIERQRNSVSFMQEHDGDANHDDDNHAGTGNKSNVQIIILAMDQSAHEELVAIKDVISEGDKELGDMIYIVPYRRSHQDHQEVEGVLRNVLIRAVDHTEKVNAAVPMGLFPKLAKRVYSRVGWTSSTRKNLMELTFETRRVGRMEKHNDNQDTAVKKKKEGEEKLLVEGLPLNELTVLIDESIEKFTIQIDEKLNQLEMKQDEVLLDENKMPILEFGRDAADVLSLASKALNTREIRKLIHGGRDSKSYIESRRSQFISMVNDKVRRLFENQMNSLREYYGRKYEAVIEKLGDAMVGDIYGFDKEQMKQRRLKFEKILAEEAKRSTEGFRAAAENAIPGIVKTGELKHLGKGYVYDSALDGLIRDMMKATLDSQNLEDEWESLKSDTGEPDGGVTKKKPRGPLKWYEKLAARALVFGVNYLQGWFAYQGIKKAAAERDRMMPKFPLF